MSAAASSRPRRVVIIDDTQDLRELLKLRPANTDVILDLYQLLTSLGREEEGRVALQAGIAAQRAILRDAEDVGGLGHDEAFFVGAITHKARIAPGLVRS